MDNHDKEIDPALPTPDTTEKAAGEGQEDLPDNVIQLFRKKIEETLPKEETEEEMKARVEKERIIRDEEVRKLIAGIRVVEKSNEERLLRMAKELGHTLKSTYAPKTK